MSKESALDRVWINAVFITAEASKSWFVNEDEDTVAQKIAAVKRGQTRVIILSEDELIDPYHIQEVREVIKDGKLQYFEAPNCMTELSVQKIVETLKEYGRKLDARIACPHIYGSSLVDLDAILRDYPNIECRVDISNENDELIGHRVINPKVLNTLKILEAKKVLSFDPESSEEDEDSEEEKWENEEEKGYNEVSSAMPLTGLNIESASVASQYSPPDSDLR